MGKELTLIIVFIGVLFIAYLLYPINNFSFPTESKDYTCGEDIYNCSDFATIEEALDYIEFCGQDYSKLDSDKDGIPCESKPSK